MPELGLLSSWPEAGPTLAWSFRNAGVGYSSPAVVDGRVYLTGGRQGKAELFCLDAASGKEIWSLPINQKSFDFEGNSWGAGPRAATTVDGDLIFALAGDGQLVCASTDGTLKWQLNMVSDLGVSIKNVNAGEPETVGWGFCWGPLVLQANDNQVDLIFTLFSHRGSHLDVPERQRSFALDRW